MKTYGQFGTSVHLYEQAKEEILQLKNGTSISGIKVLQSQLSIPEDLPFKVHDHCRSLTSTFK